MSFVYKARYAFIPAAAVFLAVSVICFIALMSVSGRRPDTEELRTGSLDRVPFDLLAAVFAACVAGAFLLLDGAEFIDPVIMIMLVCCGFLILLAFFIGLCMCAASRIKRGVFWKNTVIGFCVGLALRGCRTVLGWLGKLWTAIRRGIGRIPLVPRTAAALAASSVLDLLICAAFSNLGAEEGVIVPFLIRFVIIVPLVLYIAWCLRTLLNGGKALAEGDLSYRTDTSGMILDLKKHGEDLNSIADGMDRAVEERLRSERMKTELITNVSHDIKTPLTSIINYAVLIGNEQCDNPAVKEYSEVLVRQSDKLKRLIEDLVEASKASTGNLDVEPVPCDASVFITQAAGEYEEKLKEAELTLVSSVPDEEIRIMADGRRMWRIFDNLMNNICKYAQPGTRVYLSLEKKDGNAVITFRNISRDPLNVSEEELMERFVRGDSSRSTEGNGLGLSIARSMAELQKGSLDLSIDGDLFKAILTFPLI